MTIGKGLFRQKGGNRYYVRRRVPLDLVPRIGRKFLQETTGTSDFASAKRVGADKWAAWDVLFDEARKLGAGPLAAVEDVDYAIGNWRRAECSDAAGLVPAKPVEPIAMSRSVWASVVGSPGRKMALDLSTLDREAPPVIGYGVNAWARRYFDDRPDLSRDRATPHATAILLGRLQPAVRDPEAWRDIDGFDAALEAAAKAGGLVGAIPAVVMAASRHRFALAWLEVVQHHEAARSRAVAFLEAFDAQIALPSSVSVAAAPGSYTPREGDRTVGEVVEKFQTEKRREIGGEAVDRRYAHIFQALKETLGESKPIRAVTRDDCREVRDFLERVPASASKKWPKLTLAEATAKADEIDAKAGDKVVKRLAPNTVRSYLVNLSAVLNWSIDEKYIAENPTKGLIPTKLDSVKREDFSADELTMIFGTLEPERERHGWKFWLPALATYSGARLGELCQARVADVRHIGNVHYLVLTEFDETGRRVEGKKLKTAPSQRNLPIHSDLIAAGFLDYVASRPADGLLFDVKLMKGRSASHYTSKWWGSFLDSIGLVDPSKTAHGFRHGFRNAARRAGIADSFVDALGGWAAKGEAARYGDRERVPELSREMERISFGAFRLPGL